MAVVALIIACFLLVLLATRRFAAHTVSSPGTAAERFTFAQTLTLLGTPAVAAAWAIFVIAGHSPGIIRPQWAQYVVFAGIPGALGALVGAGIVIRRRRQP